MSFEVSTHQHGHVGEIRFSAPPHNFASSLLLCAIADAIDAVIDTFKRERQAGEHFIDAVKRLGLDPFKTAANAVRTSTAKA